MRNRKFWLACLAVVVVSAGAIGRAQMTPWLQWTFLPNAIMSEIVGESSGENAFHMIMETGGYDRDRSAEEFGSLFHETQFYLDKAKEYGLAGAEVVRFPGGGPSWDAMKGELWEVSPIRQKIASYVDSIAMLAQGSTTGEATGELVWVGAGRAEDLQGKDLAGKIAVTEGSIGGVHRAACVEKGALGVIGVMNSPRVLFDPLQMSWANISGTADKPARFAFQVPPRDGEYLKRRLLAGQKITVKAQVSAEMRKARSPGCRLAHSGHRPERRRSHLLRAPLRGVHQAGRERRHLRLRGGHGDCADPEPADQGRPHPPAETDDPLRHRPRVCRDRSLGEGEQGR